MQTEQELSQEIQRTREMINLYRKEGVNKELEFKWIRTPDIIWNDLKSEFDFTIDACASDHNHLLPRYWTKEQDAMNSEMNLKQDTSDH